jgi:hypothetical protein
MYSHRRLALWVAVFIGIAARPVRAQAGVVNGDTWYVGGFALASIQPGGHIDSEDLSGALGGTVPAVSGVVGAQLSQWVSAEAEVSLGGTFSSPQADFHAFPSVAWTASHRDLVFSGQIRYHPASKARRLRLEPLAGLGVAHGATVQKFSSATAFPTNTLPGTWLTAIFGLDVELPVTTRVAVVPSARLYWVLNRDEAYYQTTGLGSFIYRVGVGAEFKF